LRHTAVAFWIAAGTSPKEIAVRAGHTSVSTVLDRYGHLLARDTDDVTDALDAMAQAAIESTAKPATVLELDRRRGLAGNLADQTPCDRGSASVHT